MSPPTGLRAAIRSVYAEVRAPEWAAPNLDALSDVLRDLSWLPAGEVVVGAGVADGGPALDAADAARLMAVLDRAVAESAGGPRPVVLAPGSPQAAGPG